MMPQNLIEPLLDNGHVSMLREAVGDEDLCAMMADLAASARDTLRTINDALSAEDIGQARRGAHVLKGLASCFGAARLAVIAREFEDETSSITSISQGIPGLERTIEATSAAVVDMIRDAQVA
jgi:HPt (histidine-containing phosphotransfer) domain-containing protein